MDKKYNIQTGMVNSLVIITESFLGTPTYSFGYIYSDYYIGERRGYNIVSLYHINKGSKTGFNITDLGGFSEQEISKFTIPYIDKHENISDIKHELNYSLNISNYPPVDRFIMNLDDGNIMADYFTNRRLSSYIREYNINNILDK